MATLNQKDVQELFIGGAAVATTGDIDSLNVGEIGLFTPSGTRLTEATAATADRFVMVTKRSANTAEPILVSSVINKADLVKANCKRTLWKSTTEQLDYVGFNGVSGAIDVIDDNLYHVRVNLHQSITSNIGGMSVKHGIYQSGISATQADIAQGLVESLINDFSKETDKQIIPTRVNSNAGAATTGSGTFTFTGNSKYVAVGTDADAVLAVGDYLRDGTAVTDAVYKVVAIDTTNDILTLDVPYQSADTLSTKVVRAEAAVEFIAAADALAANFGVKLQGAALPHVTGKINFAIASWTTTLENTGTTGITSVGATPGSGNTKQMKDTEWFVQGNEGDYVRMGEPNLYPIRSDVQDGTSYHLIDLAVEKVYTGSIVSGPIHKVYTVALPAADATTTSANYALAATGDDITDVLEVLIFGAAGGELSVG